MKSIRFIFVFIIALVFLLGLQAIWLYNTYQMEKEKTQETITNTFLEAAKLELSERLIALEAIYKQEGVESVDFSGLTIPMDSTTLSQQNIVPMEFIAMQYIVGEQAKLPLNLYSLDSIYTLLLEDKKIHAIHNIIYSDSLGNIQEQTFPDIKQGYKTPRVPIINSESIQAITYITIPTIFRNMGGLLLLSALIVCLIISCLIYAAHTLITQQQLNKLRDNFTYAITHDMKTPLATIHTVLDQTEKGILDNHPEMKSKFTKVAIEQTLNLQALVNQILTVAYIEQRRLSLNKQSTNLPDMIQSLIDKFSVGQEKKIEFSTRYDLKDNMLYVDSFYLSNAISNLIDNAVKYSGDHVRIDISVEEKGKQLYIHVKDNARGISEKDQKKIFNRFERGVEIKRKTTSGFGIGLNYVKSVVEAHGGGITLNSKEGIGSEFVITLPLNQ